MAGGAFAHRSQLVSNLLLNGMGAQTVLLIGEHKVVPERIRPTRTIVVERYPASWLAPLDIVEHLHCARQHCKGPGVY